MAHKKAGGSSRNGRDSASKRLGVKLGDGQYAKSGAIIVRQRGTKFHPGLNVKKGKDDTLFSTITGVVKFTTKKVMKFNNKLASTKFINVVIPQSK